MSDFCRRAPLWRRLAALLYDAFLLFGLLMIYGWGAVLLEKFWMGKDAIEKSPTAGGNWLVFCGMVLVVTGFYSVFWCKNQQTLGMQAWRLQIVTDDGSAPTLKHCLRRLAAATLSIACGGLGYLWCLLPARKAWHDSLSGTQITVHEKRVAR